jgi:NRPS condensation-like uncharacterized protein
MIIIALAVLAAKEVIRNLIQLLFKFDINLIFRNMLKRERNALNEMYLDAEYDVVRHNDINDELNLTDIDKTLDTVEDILPILLRRLVAKANLKFWQRIAFAIVIQVIKALVNKKQVDEIWPSNKKG